MSARLDRIVRHPLKAIGREDLARADLAPGSGLPGDRRWAVTHERTRDAGPGWAQKANFLRGVSGPALMAVEGGWNEAAGTLTLRHPGQGEVTAAPDTGEGADRLLAWLAPLWPADLPRPTGIARCPSGFTDVPEPWLSLASLASHRAVEGRAGRTLSPHRWRANLWVEGLEPWEELGLAGRHLRVGASVLRVEEPITRCKATHASPETGRRDVDMLGVLETFGHQEFGVYASVVEGGAIAPGAAVEPLR